MPTLDTQHKLIKVGTMVAEKKLQSKQNIQLKSTTKHNGQNKLRHRTLQAMKKKFKFHPLQLFFSQIYTFFFIFLLMFFHRIHPSKLNWLRAMYLHSTWDQDLMRCKVKRLDQVQKVRQGLLGFFYPFFMFIIFLELCFVIFCGLLYIKLALGCLIILILFLPLFC